MKVQGQVKIVQAMAGAIVPQREGVAAIPAREGVPIVQEAVSPKMG
jgi:hypothetical protein